MGIKVVSAFDGLSEAYLALDRAGIKVDVVAHILKNITV